MRTQGRYPIPLIFVPLLGMFLVVVLLNGNIAITKGVSLGTPTSNPNSLQILLTNTKCKRACWQGIEPGISDVELLRKNWALNQSVPSINSGVDQPDPNNAFIDWLVRDYPLAPSDPLVRQVSATTWKGTVIQMIVPVEICPAQIVDDFGIPSSIEKSEDIYYLLYTDSGLVFASDFKSSSFQIILVFLVSEQSARNFNYPEASWKEIAPAFAAKCNSTEFF